MLSMRSVFLFLFCALSTALVHAQGSYATRPVRMIVLFAPGGASDFVARMLQPKLSDTLGQQIVIDNRAGASGNIGVEMAARLPADGHTVLLGNVGTMAINPAVFPKLDEVAATMVTVAFTEFMKAQTAFWAKLVKETGVGAE